MGSAQGACTVCQKPKEDANTVADGDDEASPVTTDTQATGTRIDADTAVSAPSSKEPESTKEGANGVADSDKPDPTSQEQMADEQGAAQDCTNDPEDIGRADIASQKVGVDVHKDFITLDQLKETDASRLSVGNRIGGRDSVCTIAEFEEEEKFMYEQLSCFDEQHLPKNNSLMHFITGNSRVSVASVHDEKLTRKRSRASLLSEADGAPKRQSLVMSIEDKRRSSLISCESTAFNNFNESDYTLGQVLGEGSFGIVVACKRAGRDELAVKLVDKVEAPMVSIIKEAQIQFKLHHPNIAKFHDFFDEKFFACIVMDKYDGGSLIQGMHRSLKGNSYSGLDCNSVTHITYQLAAALHYIHENMVLHRDINGDNYFLDRLDILDPECKVALGDFGFASEVQSGERVRGQVGRKLFWAPEIASTKSCSFPADVWALGVTIFGLLDGRFPFSDEKDAAKGQAIFRCDAHPALKDLVNNMLKKDESARIGANAITDHPWITQQNLETYKGNANSKKKNANAPRLTKKPTFRRGRSDEETSCRRKMLLDRLLVIPGFFKKQSHDIKKALTRGRKSFSVTNRASRSSRMVTKYELWQFNQVMKEGLLRIDMAPKDAFEEHWLHTVTQLLKQHHFDIKKIKGPPLQKLSDEVSRGASRLMLDATKHQTLVRAINTVMVYVRTNSFAGEQRVLLQKVQATVDGEKQNIETLPGMIKEAHENNEGTAWRVIREHLGFDDTAVNVTANTNEHTLFEGEVPDDSRFAFPGIQTVCKASIVEFVVVTNDEQTLTRMGLQGMNQDSGDLDTSTMIFKSADGIESEYCWASAADAQDASLGLESATSMDDNDSRMVPASVGPNFQELKSFFTKRNIDISSSDHRSLEDLYAETRKGVSSLVMQPSGDIIHVVDIVLLQLKDKTGRILVETEQTIDGKKNVKKRMPSTKRRAGENHFFSVWRLIEEDMMLDVNMVRIDVSDVGLYEKIEDSLRIPGLQTVFRTRLIKGQIVTTSDQNSPK